MLDVSQWYDPTPLNQSAPQHYQMDPGKDVAVDLMGPLSSGHSFMVIVDYYSRFCEVEVMQSITTEKVIDRLADTFCRHGLLATIKCDNGQQFKLIN